MGAACNTRARAHTSYVRGHKVLQLLEREVVVGVGVDRVEQLPSREPVGVARLHGELGLCGQRGTRWARRRRGRARMGEGEGAVGDC